MLIYVSVSLHFPFHNFNLVGGEVVEGVDVAVDGGFEGGDVGGGVGHGKDPFMMGMPDCATRVARRAVEPVGAMWAK